MSGGSHNYLCYSDIPDVIEKTADMEKMEQVLIEMGYTDIAKDVRRVQKERCGVMELDFDKCIKDGVAQAMKECELTIGMTLKEVVEKHIPQKPIVNKGKIQCINGHNQPTQHYKYCPMCGQLMDWSDTSKNRRMI